MFSRQTTADYMEALSHKKMEPVAPTHTPYKIDDSATWTLGENQDTSQHIDQKYLEESKTSQNNSAFVSQRDNS
jgi:hypothetical protein